MTILTTLVYEKCGTDHDLFDALIHLSDSSNLITCKLIVLDYVQSVKKRSILCKDYSLFSTTRLMMRLHNAIILKYLSESLTVPVSEYIFSIGEFLRIRMHLNTCPIPYTCIYVMYYM